MRERIRRPLTWLVALTIAGAYLGFSSLSQGAPGPPRRPRTGEARHRILEHRTAPLSAATRRRAALAIAPALAAAPADPGRVDVTVDPAAQPMPVPASFLGLSTEYWAVPHYARQRQLFGRVIGLLRSHDGPLVLRIGGDSADLSWWKPLKAGAPPWAYPITGSWLQETARLVREQQLKVILDLNLVSRNPLMAAAWVKAFAEQVPAGALQAVEIGNEPDLYHGDWDWVAKIAGIPRRKLASYILWTHHYSSGTYVQQFASYADALHGVGEGTLAGPALAYPQYNDSWIRALISRDRTGVQMITAHRYPLSACEHDPARSDFPTIGRLLADSSSRGLALGVKQSVLLAHSYGLPFRLTEMNSVTCGGRNGVSDTFANALWAPDALFELIRVGVDAVNFHVRTDAVNAPFFITDQGLKPSPLLYGLVMFEHMLAPGAKVMPLTVTGAAGAHLKAWAVALTDGDWRVLLDNKGAQRADAFVHLPTGAVASAEQLQAPSPSADAHVTLGGQTLGRAGNWEGRVQQTQIIPTIDQVSPVLGEYQLTVPAYSAAIVNVQIPAGVSRDLLAHRNWERLMISRLSRAAVR